MHLSDWPFGRRAAGRPGPGRADGTGAGGVLGRVLDPQGERDPRPAAVAVVDRGNGRCRGADAAGAVIAAEVNVREVVLTSADAVDAPVSQRLTVNARAAGPRLGRDVQTVIKASKSGDWSVSADGVVVAGGIELVEGEYTLETTLAEGGTASGLLSGGGFVVLDTTVTPELAAEGVARDVIRAVQQARRDAGLEVTDRMRLSVTADAGRARRRRGASRADHGARRWRSSWTSRRVPSCWSGSLPRVGAMETRRLGRTGRDVGVVGLGAWQLGGRLGRGGRERCARRAADGGRGRGHLHRHRGRVRRRAQRAAGRAGAQGSHERPDRGDQDGPPGGAGPGELQPRELPGLERPVPARISASTRSIWSSCTARRRRCTRPTRCSTRSTTWSPRAGSRRTA